MLKDRAVLSEACSVGMRLVLSKFKLLLVIQEGQALARFPGEMVPRAPGC